MQKKTLVLATFFLVAISTTKLFAVRPFITDDAAVALYKQFQLETWTYFDKFGGKHWFQVGYGLTRRLELSFAGVYGYALPDDEKSEFSFTMPLLEAKFLFRESLPDKPPGIAMALGTHLPTGKGEFVPAGRGAYTFLCATQTFGEDENIVFHGNVGLNYLYEDSENNYISYWGIGTQIKAYKGLHAVFEIISGDPYDPKTGLAYQAGFRYFISDNIQVDAEIGQGISGDFQVPFWAGFGLRFATLTPKRMAKKFPPMPTGR